MGTSLLLHALSLKDRMLEPNQLPLLGQVWAYDKDSCSREMFVGNCISMLSSLGVHDAEISWNNDIMAFDASHKEQPVTIIISLKDDSLASDFYYFLGIWSCPKPGRVAGAGVFSDASPWNDEDLLKPDATFGVRVLDRPAATTEMQDVLGQEVFGQMLYQDHFRLCGKTVPGETQTGEFILYPTDSGLQNARFEIRHALYSLRNLMALMSRVMKKYEKLLADDVGMKLYQDLLLLMSRAEAKSVAVPEWDNMVCENGRVSLRAASQVVNLRNIGNELHGIRRLFDAIVGELNIEEMKEFPSLIERMLIPFAHASDLLEDRLEMVRRSEQQAQILQQLLHSRMLANQQKLLIEMLERSK